MDASTAADSQRHLDDLLEHLPAGVVMHGADGRILSANRLACELLGQSPEQLKGTVSDATAWHFLRSNILPMPPEEFPVNVVLRTRQRVSHVIVGVPDPEPGREPLRWLICNAYPECDAAGVLVQVVVCFTDCTALKRAKQRLQKSEKRLQLVLRGSTDAPWDADLTNGEVYYSQRWWDMVGHARNSLPADDMLWLNLTHPDDRPRVEAFLRDFLQSRRESYAIEFRLRHRQGHYLPVLSRGFVLRDREGRPLRISGTNTDLTERKRAERRIYEAAYFDHLTGLPNRRFLLEELDKVMSRTNRSGCYSALLFLDLDNFKLLNDTLGHDLGDLLLRNVAQRLRLTLRHSDQVARLGGDEFVIVLESLADSVPEAVTEANHVIEKLLAALDQPYYLKERLIVSTPSIGIVLFDGASADVETLLKQADLAMYKAKAEGRNTARFFDPSMQAAAERQAAFESALQHGLQAHEFVLYCQPQFSTHGRLVGAEVLVRWRREDGSLVAPAEFIGLAESSGLIVPLGQYVLEQGCRALSRWATDRALARLKLAVNVSAHQLRDVAFSEAVTKILDTTGAPADKLCLELTESVFAENGAEIIERMHALCRHGLCFSLDDFGTGYSSLAYLKRFPLSSIKIDRSFVHDVHVDPNAAPIVEAIIALARSLKLEIVAEGVEHEAQRRFLVKGGCSALQGYLLGPPVPIEDFERTYSASGMGHA